MLVTYAGGPIVRCPLVYTSFWGPAWSDPAHQALAAQLNQFHQDILRSTYMNVLTQYGVWLGAGTGAFIQSSFLPSVSGTLTVSDYESILQQCIDIGAIPEPQDARTAASIDVVVIYLDENVIINGGGRQLNFSGAADIGYHDHFQTNAGHQFYYAFIAYSPDVTFGTVVASHELAEMITDPEYDAWTPDNGYHEIGDYCESNDGTITVCGNTWTVQQIYSNTDGTCVTDAPAPLQALSPGPYGAAGLDAQMRGRGPRRLTAPASHERVLPLPSMNVDLDAGTATWDEDEMRSYVRAAFHPLSHETLFGDNFTGFLRQVIDTLEKESGQSSARSARNGQARQALRARGSIRARNGLRVGH